MTTAHFLNHGKPCGRPARMLSVGFSTRQVAYAFGDKRVVKLELDAFSISGSDWGGEKWSTEAWVDTAFMRDLWIVLPKLFLQGRTTWVWTTNTYKLLSSSGFFSRMERGEYDYSGVCDTIRGDEPQTDTRGFRGYLACDDKTFVLLCTHVPTGSQVLFMDTKNFDVDLSRDGHNQNVMAHSINRWTQQLCEMVQRESMGPLRPTAAGQAIAAYRSKHISCPMLCHGAEPVRRLERDSYFPGRCQAFRIGQSYGPIYHLDITSCYPAISAAASLPVRLRGFWESDPPPLEKLFADGRGVISRVTLRENRGRFPYRDRNGISYPLGVWTVSLCGPELQIALESNSIARVHGVAVYDTWPCLRSWSQSMLGLRDCEECLNNVPLRKAIKAITNRLYGTFARRTRAWKRCSCRPARTPYDMWYGECPQWGHVCEPTAENVERAEPWHERERRPTTRWRSVNWNVEYMESPADHDDSMVAVAAWVNSLARVQLMEILERIPGDDKLYCDTDGLFVTQRGYDLLQSDGVLGDGRSGSLRLVAVHRDMFIRGHKSYRVGPVQIHAGSPKNAVFDDDGKLTWDDCETLYGCLKSHRIPDGRLIGRHRKLPERLAHGTVTSSGRVLPHYIMEEE
jgi:hypothetical protein